MGSFVYVDNSNVWIEGMHVSAVSKGIAKDLNQALQNRICDYDWVYDFGKLLEFAGGTKEEISRAILFGSRPPVNDSLWQIARKKGFEVKTEDRNYYTNREKKIDSGICTIIMEDSYTIINPKKDEVVLVAGDRDYVPTGESLKKRGILFSVCFWDHASQELKEVADNFHSLNKYLTYLALKII